MARSRRALALWWIFAVAALGRGRGVDAQTCDAGSYLNAGSCEACGSGKYATAQTAVCVWNVPTSCDGGQGSTDWENAIKTAHPSLDGTKVAATCTFPSGGLSFFYRNQTSCAFTLTTDQESSLSGASSPVAVPLTLNCIPKVTPEGEQQLVCDATSLQSARPSLYTGCADVENGFAVQGSTVTCTFDGGQSSCVTCPVKTECTSTTTSVAVPCPAGEYNDVAGENCKNCPAGYECATEATENPTICPAGSAAAERSTACTPCAAGTNATQPGTATCAQCPAGYSCTSTGTVTPTACAAGNYAAAGSSTCTPCAAGTYANETASATCAQCPAGYSCTSTGTVTPTACAAGNYAAAGSSTCTPCAVGSYQDLTAQANCKSCSFGESCPRTGMTTPERCGVGTYSGYVLNRDAFVHNESGPYNASENWRQPTASSTGSSECLGCPEGYYCPSTSTAPLLCPAGTYSSSNSSSCTDCEAGKSCSSPLPADRVDCVSGTFSVGKAASCTACAAGRYCPYTTQNVSLSCTFGYYSLGGAVSACTRCEAGVECPDTSGSRNRNCAIGTFSTGGQTACSYCPPGRYCNDTRTAAQYDCAAGTFSVGGQSECTPCDAGTYGTEAGAVDSSDCIKCPRGMYGTSTGASSAATCQLCPEDTSCPNPGTVTPTPCEEGRGTFGEIGQTSCGLAPPPPSPPPAPPSPSPPAPPPLNETVSAPEISIRLQGDIRNWTSVNASAFRIGIAAALNDGTRAADVEIVSVRSGSVIVAFQIITPTMLPPSFGGYWNQTYLTTVVTAISNAVVANTLRVGAVPLGAPSVDCSPGSYETSASIGTNRVCALCATGTYSNEKNAAQCELCASGTSSNFRGSSYCTPCAPGSVAPDAGSPTCSLCPRGTTQELSGMTSCTRCPDNFFADSFGSIACAACPAGFVSGAPAWVGETPRMRADGVLSVEVQEAIDGVRCIPDGTYELPPPPEPPLEERRADASSWTVAGISLSVYVVLLWILGQHVWHKERLTLKYAENDSFLSSIKPHKENTASTRGTMKEFEEDDLRYAVDSFRRGGFADAEAVYSRMAERDPNNADVLQGLSIARAYAGDLEYAHAFAQKSVSVSSTSQRQITLGNIFLSQGKTAKAIATYAMAIRRDPVSAVGHFNIANAHFMSGDLANARTNYLAALDREPHYFKALFNLAIVMDLTGSVQEARELMKRAVEARPNDVRAIYALGLLHLKLGQWKRAEEQFKSTLNIDAKHASSHVKLGNLAFRQGEFQLAGAYYLNALEVDPTNVEALTNMAMLDWCKGLSNASNEQLRLALTIDPIYYPALYNMALTRLAQGRLEECVKYYQRASACASNTALERTQIFNLSVALAEIDELDDEEVPAEFIMSAAEQQLMKIAVSKIQDDGKSSLPATSAKASKKSTPSSVVPAVKQDLGKPHIKDPSETRKYASLVFISDAVKFAERLESCALDDTCVVLYEHDMNRVVLCRKLIAKAKEKLSSARGLQTVDRIAVVAPTFVGGVQLGEHVVIDARTVEQNGDVALFLKGINEMLGSYQWQGKRLDFLTLDYTVEVNVKLLRALKSEHSFECEVSCSDAMESPETFKLTNEQLKSTLGAAGGNRASLLYFDTSALKAWAKLPRAPPQHKVVQSTSGDFLAVKGNDEYAKAKLSWRTVAKATLALEPKGEAIVPMKQAKIDPPPPMLAPPEVENVAIRHERRGLRPQKRQLEPMQVELEMITSMPVFKFKQHATQMFFCKELSLELGVNADRLRVVKTDEIADTITVRITERRDASRDSHALRSLIQKLQVSIRDGTFVIDEAFGRVDVMGVFWPPTEADERANVGGDDDKASESSSGSDTRVSHDENAILPARPIVGFSEFSVPEFGAKSAVVSSSPSSTTTKETTLKNFTATTFEQSAATRAPVVERSPALNFVDIEFNDASGALTREDAATPRWDIDRNVENLRRLERTGIWDAI